MSSRVDNVYVNDTNNLSMEKKPAWLLAAEQRYQRVQNLARARAIKRGLIPKPLQVQESKQDIEAKRIKELERELQIYKKRVKTLEVARKEKREYNKGVSAVVAKTKAKKRVEIEKRKTERTKTKLYDVTYQIKYTLIFDEEQWITRTIARRLKTTEKTITPPLTEKFKKFLKDYAYDSIHTRDSEKTIDRDSIIIISFDAVKLNPYQIADSSVGNFVMNYERFDVSSTISDRQCWYDFLIANGISDKKITDHFNMNKSHILVNELFKFVKTTCNRSIYLVDLCRNVFAKHVIERNGEVKNNHEPAMYGLIANEHIYNITDKTLRASITRYGMVGKVRNVIKSDKKYAIKEDKRIHKNLPDEINLSLLVDEHIYYKHNNEDNNINENPLIKWMYEILRVHKIVPKKIKYVGQVIVSMSWKNITFWHNRHSKICINICQALNLPYRNQSIQTLSKIVMEKLKINRDNLMSRYNDDVRKIFNERDQAKQLRCGGLNYRPADVTKNDLWQAYDIKRCYSYIASTYKLPVLTIWDNVEPFKGKIQDATFYFVEKTNMIMQEFGWYIGHIVEYCLKENLIEKENIKYMLAPSYKSNDLRTLVSGVHSLNLGMYAKELVNIAIGALATKDSKTIQSIFTTSIDEANYYRCMFDTNIVVSPVVDINNGLQRLYRIDNKVNSICAESGKPAYTAIVQIGYMLVHKLYKSILAQDVNAKLLSIHVDSVYVERSNKTHIDVTNCLTNQKSTDNIGYIREVKQIPNQFNALRIGPINIPYEYFRKDYSNWEVENVGQWDEAYAIELYKRHTNGALVLGMAGCGKSEMLKIWKKHLLNSGMQENEIITVGFTNSSMKGNIQGQTLHSLFGIGVEKSNEDCSVDVKKHLLDSVKICFVDEISMVPGYMYSYLLLLKQIGAKLFMFGDFKQIPPIEPIKRDYENSCVLKQLTSGKKIQLTHNYRSDTKYVQVCETGRFDFDYFERNINDLIEFDKFNIARNDNICDKINKECANVYGAKGQSGSRLLVAYNFRKLGIYKNQFYEVINKEEKKIKQLFIDNAIERVIDDFDLFLSKCELGYCVTVEKSQGLTLREKYTIYQFDIYEHHYRYVALSRTSNSKLVRIDGHKTGIIYKICKKKAKIADPIYIGSTHIGLERRFKQHQNDKADSKLNKYMKENECIAERLYFVLYKDLDDLLKIEDSYIKSFGTVQKGLNSRVNFQ